MAAIVAWVLAVWQAEHDAVAAAFAVAGSAMLLAAAFYSRVRQVGREGVVLDPWEAAERLVEAIEETPVEADDSPEEVKERAADVARWTVLSTAEDAPRASYRPSPSAQDMLRQMAWNQVAREQAMRAAIESWLPTQGFGSPSLISQRPLQVRAERGGVPWRFRFGGAASNATAAHVDSLAAAGDPDERRAFVLSEPGDPPAETRARAASLNVALLVVDPYRGSVRVDVPGPL